MISEHDLLARFDRVEPRGPRDWLVSCPAHDDRQPSLHITLKPERWQLHCFAGCTFEAVCAAAALKPGDLTDSPSRNGRRRGKIVETYEYVDAAGTPLFEVCRFEPKRFVQRRPDATGGWVW